MESKNKNTNDDLAKIKDIFTDLKFEMGMDHIVEHLDMITNGYIAQRDPDDKEKFLFMCNHIEDTLLLSQQLKKFILKIDCALNPGIQPKI